MNISRYITAARQVYKEIKIQKKYSKEYIEPYLNELENKYGGSFQKEQKQKILSYYGLFITSFLCASYKRLYNKKLTAAERHRASLFGILTPVGDDLFDIDKLEPADIYRLTFSPQQYNATTFSAKVAKEMQSFLLENVPHKLAYTKASEAVLKIQEETAKQTYAGISEAELERITYTKGAVSVIIYHQCLDDAADKNMLEALTLIGGLYQLGNDLFDLYKDVRDNIYTLVNTCEDYEVLQTKFIDRVKLQNKKIMQLPYAEKNKEIFCIIMNTINARSMVALEQFIKTQQKEKNKIDWWHKERKDMIVDMEKLSNLRKWFYYVWKLPRLQ